RRDRRRQRRARDGRRGRRGHRDRARSSLRPRFRARRRALRRRHLQQPLSEDPAMTRFARWTATIAIGAASLGCGGYCEPSEGTLCTVAGTGDRGLFGDGADARAAELYMPMDVTVGPDGRLFIVDWNNHRIRAVDEAHVIETVVGSGDLGDGPPGPAL